MACLVGTGSHRGGNHDTAHGAGVQGAKTERAEEEAGHQRVEGDLR